MDSLRLLIDPLRPALSAGPETGMHFLIRVQAPPPPPSRERSPFHLALVLDRSGSMSGGPLREAITCAKEIVRRLTPRDKAAVVVYDDQAQVLVPCSSVDDPQRLCNLLDGIHSGGMTDLHQGWSVGVGQLRDAAAPGVLSQVLLLSDGNANKGVTDPSTLGDESAMAQASGVGTSTYGLGRQFDEDTMSMMAAKGRGRAYFGQTATDLLPLFLEEFELMSDLFAKEVILHIQPKPGVKVRMLNPYEAFGADGWNLPSVPFAGEAWAVIHATAGGTEGLGRDLKGECPLFRVRLEWKKLDGTPQVHKAITATLPVRSPEEVKNLKDDALVALRIRDLQAAELQNRIQAASLCGDWDQVKQLLDQLRLLIGDDPILRELLEPLERMARDRDESRTAKSARYASYELSCTAFASTDLDAEEADPKAYFRGSRGSRKPPKPASGSGGKSTNRRSTPEDGNIPPSTPP